MRTHQNKREALIIGEIFYSLGYNVKVARCNAPKECDDRHYDIIFGLDPNFVTMSQKNPKNILCNRRLLETPILNSKKQNRFIQQKAWNTLAILPFSRCTQ